MVASPLVTVVDDPRVLGSRGSINVDDEGVVPKPHTLIADGKLRAYLHDRISAKWFGVAPTGSGRRESFRHTPMPRMSNTYMLEGQDDPEDIVKSVKRGVYAKKFSGGQVNISNGDFVFSLVEGYLIENGRITAPLKGVNLIGNGPEALATVSMVGWDFQASDGMWTCGKDGQSVPVGVGMPTVKLDSLTVGGTAVGE
jgi:TldD protein